MLVVATMLGPVVASAWMVNGPVPGRAVGLGAACRSATLRMDDTVEPGFETPEPQVRGASPAVPRPTVPTHASSCPTRAQVNLQTVAPGCSPCTIKVIGVGGGGGNTLNRMVQEGPGVERSTFLEYVACNTDMQALSSSLADRRAHRRHRRLCRDRGARSRCGHGPLVTTPHCRPKPSS